MWSESHNQELVGLKVYLDGVISHVVLHLALSGTNLSRLHAQAQKVFEG